MSVLESVIDYHYLRKNNEIMEINKCLYFFINSIKHFIYIFCVYTILNLKQMFILFKKKTKILSDFNYWQLFVQLSSYYLKDVNQKARIYVYLLLK